MARVVLRPASARTNSCKPYVLLSMGTSKAMEGGIRTNRESVDNLRVLASGWCSLGKPQNQSLPRTIRTERSHL